ncbi:FxsB family cyclophane-forming radical SAM/SPASM peptide maturase [Nocardioides sp. W7]|uniref:FxsB family cyclophane-forming radical SAM/SPASM peptide maturase n=1 Tax=Nocardioides sp. W7 TaxID=2931390 RepID=UPI001FCFC328|nr:FxsB family cyclophane-forming radical SAM/SPASM peptide maturase [Nocardioides sp. W7]
MHLWPFDGSCDYDHLIGTGWTPSPLNEFIFKIESRCNLNCDYCYVYNLGDESWRTAPRFMTPDIARMAARRIRAHAETHGLTSVGISFHGGEPLLRGVAPVRRLYDSISQELGDLPAEYSIQTNGTLITEEVAADLAAMGLRVGVSLDGDEEGNKHRLDLGGKSSYARTVRGVQLLAQHEGLLQGALAVIDITADPARTYRAIADCGFRSVDFLFPHGTWELLPPGKTATDRTPSAPAPYAEWLLAIYEEWADDPDRMRVRIFDDIIHLLLGGQHSFETLGVSPARLAVVEADGGLELVDHVGVTYEGAAETGANVLTHRVDDLLRHPGVTSRQLGRSALADSCSDCALVDTCGGGLITHRFDQVNGFKNPTVYCSDLYTLIEVIGRDLEARIGVATGVLAAQ